MGCTSRCIPLFFYNSQLQKNEKPSEFLFVLKKELTLHYIVTMLLD